jgi:hypothetical protein
MRRTLPATLLPLLCAGLMAATGRALATTPRQSTKPAQPTANTLTSAEKAAGWRLLFDGKTTAGWRVFKKTEMTAGWTVEAGALTRSASAGDIVTVDEFDNFELTFDWMVAPGANSGVFGRVTEDSTAVWHSATEYQILDNKGHADGKKPETTAGSAYALYAPVKDVTKALGEWNQGKIVMKGAHVEHWLNGVKIVEFEVGSADWTERVEKSKFKPYPQFGKAPRGRIAIQDHGDKVSYRNIKIRSL